MRHNFVNRLLNDYERFNRFQLFNQPGQPSWKKGKSACPLVINSSPASSGGAERSYRCMNILVWTAAGEKNSIAAAILLISLERHAYIVSIMGRIEKDSLGEFEQMVLLAALRLRDEAYAVTIRREIERRTGRSVSRGAVYITLDRLEKKGLLTSYMANSTAERGGRAKRYYQVKPVGEAALKDSWTAMRKMWEGLEPVVRKV
jgi:PadR family transcriptional regulator, regulatory protein PadR